MLFFQDPGKRDSSEADAAATCQAARSDTHPDTRRARTSYLFLIVVFFVSPFQGKGNTWGSLCLSIRSSACQSVTKT